MSYNNTTQDNVLSMLVHYATRHPGENPDASPMYKLFMILYNFKDADVLQDALDTIRGYRQSNGQT